MKMKSASRLAGLCALCVTATVPFLRGASAPLASEVDVKAREDAAASTALTRAEALKLVADARRYVAHPAKPQGAVTAPPQVTWPDFVIDSPPPAARSEMKTEAPGTGYVWVEGYYMPVKGQWRWVRGEWAVPALPISVWIPGRYDEKEKQWYPGYWQPDLPGPAPTDPATTKDPKSAPPVSNGNNGY